jgi:carboxymethylenebutenolidase
MVTTSANQQSGMTEYPSQDGTPINPYLSQPTTTGAYPGVIVTMEGMGLEDHVKDLCRRFAEQGYIAIAPDLYTRRVGLSQKKCWKPFSLFPTRKP